MILALSRMLNPPLRSVCCLVWVFPQAMPLIASSPGSHMTSYGFAVFSPSQLHWQQPSAFLRSSGWYYPRPVDWETPRKGCPLRFHSHLHLKLLPKVAQSQSINLPAFLNLTQPLHYTFALPHSSHDTLQLVRVLPLFRQKETIPQSYMVMDLILLEHQPPPLLIEECSSTACI